MIESTSPFCDFRGPSVQFILCLERCINHSISTSTPLLQNLGYASMTQEAQLSGSFISMASIVQTNGLAPSQITTTSPWAHKYRGVLFLTPGSQRSLQLYNRVEILPGYGRRPRPTPCTFLETHRLHLHRSHERIRTRLHPSNRRRGRHPSSTRLPQHPSSERAVEEWHSQRLRSCRKSHAEVQTEGQCLQGHHNGHTAGGAGSILQRRGQWERTARLCGGDGWE